MKFQISRELTGLDTAQLASSICRNRGMLFERFDLHTRTRTRCIIAWRWQDLNGSSFEDVLRSGIENAPEDVLHLAFLGGKAGENAAVGHEGFPPWFVRRLQTWVELDFTKGEVSHTAALGDALEVSALDSWLSEARQNSMSNNSAGPKINANSNQQWAADLDLETYSERMHGLQQHITNLEIEGAVLSVCLSKPTTAHPLDIYGEMARTNPSTFGYCFYGDKVALAGSSPLAFLDYEDGEVRLETDAGTRPVTGVADVDSSARLALLASVKDATEHAVVVNEETQSLAMLTDDGAAFKGVRRLVDREVRAFSHVMHLYTVLAATLRKDIDLPAALIHLFPPAAVSGRPRHAALRIGRSAEMSPRGPYGGIAGLVRGNKSAQFAVVIRSLWIEHGVANLRVGGKIVAHSQPDDEYAEALNKSRFIAESVRRVEGAK
jgi:anthranilate synthase component I